MSSIKRISIVLAKGCPHCVPPSLDNTNRIAKDLGVPLRVLDIDIPEQLKVADRLVEKHGDWSEDYLIPQVFIEYADGRVNHVFTGFSEAVSMTQTCWKNFFSSNYYHKLIHKQNNTDSNLLKWIIVRYLTFKGRCRKHCEKSTSFVELWSGLDGVVGAYVCPDGYVSRVVYFSANPDIEWFKNFLSSQFREEIVNSRDIRPATRYGWELGDIALAEIREISPTTGIKEIYWTIYPQNEDEKRRGVFLCLTDRGECQKLFIQDIKSRNRLCLKCTKKV